MTSAWNRNELEEIGAAAELSVAPRRPDETLRPFTTIWVARVGDDRFRAYQSRRYRARRAL